MIVNHGTRLLVLLGCLGLIFSPFHSPICSSNLIMNHPIAHYPDKQRINSSVTNHQNDHCFAKPISLLFSLPNLSVYKPHSCHWCRVNSLIYDVVRLNRVCLNTQLFGFMSITFPPVYLFFISFLTVTASLYYRLLRSPSPNPAARIRTLIIVFGLRGYTHSHSFNNPHTHHASSFLNTDGRLHRNHGHVKTYIIRRLISTPCFPPFPSSYDLLFGVAIELYIPVFTLSYLTRSPSSDNLSSPSRRRPSTFVQPRRLIHSSPIISLNRLQHGISILRPGSIATTATTTAPPIPTRPSPTTPPTTTTDVLRTSPQLYRSPPLTSPSPICSCIRTHRQR